MIIETLSVFPGVFAPYLDASIMGRAQAKGIFSFEAYDLRDWTHDRHRTVDDAPFGGGQGMLMKPAPIFEAVRDISSRGEHAPHVVFFSPCGRRFDEGVAERLSHEDRLLFVCGRYEGMDERAYRLADDVLSLGDYVLTGGELPALVVIDAVVRLLPGALGDEMSALDESFSVRARGPSLRRPRCRGRMAKEERHRAHGTLASGSACCSRSLPGRMGARAADNGAGPGHRGGWQQRSCNRRRVAWPKARQRRRETVFSTLS